MLFIRIDGASCPLAVVTFLVLRKSILDVRARHGVVGRACAGTIRRDGSSREYLH